jgi:hypothetical protein
MASFSFSSLWVGTRGFAHRHLKHGHFATGGFVRRTGHDGIGHANR